MVRGAMSRRTLARTVLDRYRGGVTVALAEAGAQLLGRDAHRERRRSPRRPRERAAAPPEGAEAVEHDAPVGARHGHLDRGQLRHGEAERDRLVLGRGDRSVVGHLRRVDLVAAVLLRVLAEDGSLVASAEALQELAKELVV